jgi:hypothetical protein
MRRIQVALAIAASASCGGSVSKTGLIAGFTPPAAESGTTRYVLPVVHDIPPGGNVLFCQYIAGPSEKAQDVIWATGYQSKNGHHVIAYATKLVLPVGTSRPCDTEDQLNLSYLVASGKEGVGNTLNALPEGVTFRLPAGYGIMANVHYINTTDAPIDGQSVLDIKFADASPSRQPINLMPNVGDTFMLPPGQDSLDVNCPIGKDVQLILFANHEHEWGSSVFSEIIRADGTHEMLRTDDPWIPEYTFNPTMNVYPLDGSGSLMLHQGDTLHTHCQWDNTTSGMLTFPTEMCVGVALVVNDREMDCVDGQWDVNAPGPTQ